MAKQIELTKGLVAIVDDDDFERVSKIKWFANTGLSKPYATGRFGSPRKLSYMHRLILDAPAGMQVDHINGDTLDNRKENLRLCTHQQNQWNRPKYRGNSKYKGVHFCSANQRWVAYLTINRKRSYLGYFDTEEEAAAARDTAATQAHGTFAQLNLKKDA